jgi:hypothetical protein
MEPSVITQARNIREAFEMARDAMAALAASRRDLRRWDRAPAKRRQKRMAS